MAATVTISETNGVGATVTASITNTNMGSTDAVNLDPGTYPISAGASSYEKYQRLNVTNLGGSLKINNLKVWRTGALGGAATHKTNARTSGYSNASYATPVNTTSVVATQTMPTSVPSTANLGIGGSLSGEISAPGFSDYLVHQIQTNVADASGATCTQNYQYDEIA